MTDRAWSGHEFLTLSDDALAALGIGTSEIVAAIENALRAQAGGQLHSPPKAALTVPDRRYYMTTLGTADAPPLTVVKSVMVSPRNPARGLGGVEGAIFVQDSETGLLQAVMGAGWITAARTAGLSSVAAMRLANPRSQIAAFVGCGVQARSHLTAFAELFPLREIRAVGRGQANIDRLCGQARGLGLAARACTAQEALEGADLVVTSIPLDHETPPFLEAGWLKPGAFAAITDLGIPWHDAGMQAFGTLVIDDLEQEAATHPKLVDPALVTTDLGGLVTGARPAAYDPDTRAAFVFRGMAVGDYAASALALERARAAGMGTRVPMPPATGL
ncbi:MAG: ornithine cyclodeaminase family protein [Pseudomonadota bacterium]